MLTETVEKIPYTPGSDALAPNMVNKITSMVPSTSKSQDPDLVSKLTQGLAMLMLYKASKDQSTKIGCFERPTPQSKTDNFDQQQNLEISVVSSNEIGIETATKSASIDEVKHKRNNNMRVEVDKTIVFSAPPGIDDEFDSFEDSGTNQVHASETLKKWIEVDFQDRSSAEHEDDDYWDFGLNASKSKNHTLVSRLGKRGKEMRQINEASSMQNENKRAGKTSTESNAIPTKAKQCDKENI